MPTNIAGAKLSRGTRQFLHRVVKASTDNDLLLPREIGHYIRSIPVDELKFHQKASGPAAAAAVAAATVVLGFSSLNGNFLFSQTREARIVPGEWTCRSSILAKRFLVVTVRNSEKLPRVSRAGTRNFVRSISVSVLFRLFSRSIFLSIHRPAPPVPRRLSVYNRSSIVNARRVARKFSPDFG